MVQRTCVPLLVCASLVVFNALCVLLLLSGRAGVEHIQLLHPGMGNCESIKYTFVF
jgi:hypothetical protein